jgi:hypothetical protein
VSLAYALHIIEPMTARTNPMVIAFVLFDRDSLGVPLEFTDVCHSFNMLALDNANYAY